MVMLLVQVYPPARHSKGQCRSGSEGWNGILACKCASPVLCALCIVAATCCGGGDCRQRQAAERAERERQEQKEQQDAELRRKLKPSEIGFRWEQGAHTAGSMGLLKWQRYSASVN